ncbi:hypothetical protein GCM10023235_73250 [Kitasatospora terrestris]|uniref:Uncharacterized protein n=1 Tax=Kitasatospora terrestris TaxID=258051 RepID=A0ABP9ELP3_9ACTN
MEEFGAVRGGDPDLGEGGAGPAGRGGGLDRGGAAQQAQRHRTGGGGAEDGSVHGSPCNKMKHLQQILCCD